jgi:ERCC4-related helicase
MAKSSYFRVLALTATPGSTPDAVQEIVDALHISRIEIRDEGSLDLREYVHRKASLVVGGDLRYLMYFVKTEYPTAYYQNERRHQQGQEHPG